MPTYPAIGLGRVFNVVSEASGVALSLKNCNAITYVVDVSGACTLTVLAGKVYGTVATNWSVAAGFAVPPVWHQSTAADGTAGWTKVTSSWSTNVLTCAGTNHYLTAVTFFTTQMADGYAYIKATASAANNTVAILHDLSVARTPANLAIVGA